MTDLALSFNQAIEQLDVSVAGGDLVMDPGLETAIILSIMLDAPAQPGDVLPTPNSADRRGWWGDAFLPPRAGGKPDNLGSRMWLLRRAVQNNATLIAAQNYVQEALAWMIEDSVAGALNVVCTYPKLGKINIRVSISQAGASAVFNVPWSFTL